MREDSYNNDYVQNFRAKIIEELLSHARSAPNVENVALPTTSGTGVRDDPVTFMELPSEEPTTTKLPSEETKEPVADEELLMKRENRKMPFLRKSRQFQKRQAIPWKAVWRKCHKEKIPY